MKLSTQHLSAPCAGYQENGDAVVVRIGEQGSLVAVIDALGHGPKAAEISHMAVTYLERAPLDAGIQRVMDGLHLALEGTRGAAALIIIVRNDRLEGCGVGNVELRSVGSYIPVVQSPGIVGVRVRRYNPFVGSLTPGARLVLFTDGISAQVPIADIRKLPAREACEVVFRDYRKTHDDATVVVVDVEE